VTDGSNVYGNNLDLDLSSVDSTIPSVVPPADGGSSSTSSGVDFLGSLSQMGDNLLRSPAGQGSTTHLGGSTERPSTAPGQTTTSNDCAPVAYFHP